jgi:hypothetical protein
MPACEVVIQIQNAQSTDVLRRAWVYWREAGNTTLLRSDQNGRLFSLKAGADRGQPRMYTERFTANSGTTVDIYYSRGALPIPDVRLNEHNDVFFRRTLQIAVPGQLQPANVGPNNPPNTLVGAITAAVTLPPVLITLTSPLEIRLWPILWELPKDCDLDPACRALHPAARTPDYHTAGFTQGTADHLPVAEHAVVTNVLPDQVTFNGNAVRIRPREKALHFTGTIDGRATGVVIQMLDHAGNVVQLRPNIDPASTPAASIAGVVQAGAYNVDVFFADAVNTFGIVQLFVQSVGMTPPIVEAFCGYLCGFQTTLMDDGLSNVNGQVRGPSDMNESSDKLVVDYVNSPQTTRHLMDGERRLRRMHIFEMRNRQRLFDLAAPAGPANPEVLRPEMPMWMAEFHAVGVSPAPLATLMALRAFYDRSPFDLTLDLQWKLLLTWDGPDHMRDPDNLYVYSLQVAQQDHQIVRLRFGSQGQFVDAAGPNITLNAGILPNAFDPAPTTATFPVSGRRTPAVNVSGLQRAWGLARNAVMKDALVVEYQVRTVETRNGNVVELIRGGDGSLSLDITMDAVSVLAPSEPAPAIRLPRFRVIGRNPIPDITAGNLETTLINALVQEFFDQHPGDTAVQMLPLDVWQITARLIFHHESETYHQFETGNSRIAFLGRGVSLYYGNEFKMPYFGGPHGYGIVQVDYGNSLTTIQNEHHLTRDQLLDEVWNFVDDLRGGVRHLMGGKAQQALHSLGGNHVADQRRMRAVFQRAVVRAYNGGSEFHWNGADFVIQPARFGSRFESGHASKGANSAVLYPNQVFTPDGHGSNVTYFTADGHPNDVNFSVHPVHVNAVPPQTQEQADAQALGDADAIAEPRITFPWPIVFAEQDYGPGI